MILRDCQSYPEWSIKVLIEDPDGRNDENEDATVIPIRKDHAHHKTVGGIAMIALTINRIENDPRNYSRASRSIRFQSEGEMKSITVHCKWEKKEDVMLATIKKDYTIHKLARR